MTFLLIALVGVALSAPSGGFPNFLTSKYSGPELKLRLGLFRLHAKEIEAHNSLPDKTWEAGVNEFTALTDAERKQFLGLGNVTEILNLPVSEAPFSALTAAPASIDHTSLNHVTNVKNQGGCGSCHSCWAFAAAASFEGSYAIATKNLKTFAEQELLDCTYSDPRDGCKGGWYQQAWGYIQNTGRLGLLSEIPYKGKDGACNYSGKRNGAYDVQYLGYGSVSGDDNLAAATAQYVPAVAITVEDDLFSYKHGWYDGCNTPKGVNHAVTVVGYEAGFWKVKNSWGSEWGENGYVRMAREKPSICKIANYVKYPTLKKIKNPWTKVTNFANVKAPSSFKKLKLKVKCLPKDASERIKLYTYNNGQTGHIELIVDGLNRNKFSLFCKGAGNQAWFGGDRYFGNQFSDSQRGDCDSQGFREYEYEQLSDRYEVRVGSFVQKFSSRSRGRCNVRFISVMFQLTHAPEAFYKWEE